MAKFWNTLTRSLRHARTSRTPLPQSRLRLEALEDRQLLSASGLDEMAFVPQAHALTGVTPNAVGELTPAKIRQAYGFNGISYVVGSQHIPADGRGQTIAIIDAFDDPTVASDLHKFDQTFGLADPVLVKATPQGTPAPDAGWALEIALDVEYAHVIAPMAKILLVEAKTNSFTNLFGAIDFARHQAGVSVVSMSFGGGEFSNETSFDSLFTTPAGHNGVTFVASTGDGGAPTKTSLNYPAASPNVLAVGGTTLSVDAAGNYQGETGWRGSTGGLSKFEREPSYQKGVQKSGVRTNPDVAYDADPASGVPVFLTNPSTHQSSFMQVGGTSAGAPQWAGLIAIVNQGRALVGHNTLAQVPATIYALPAADFHDIVSGSNGSFSAGPGYDLVTGRGSPIAFPVIRDLFLATNPATAVGSAVGTPTASGLAASLTEESAPTAVPFAFLRSGTDVQGPVVADQGDSQRVDATTVAPFDAGAGIVGRTLDEVAFSLVAARGGHKAADAADDLFAMDWGAGDGDAA